MREAETVKKREKQPMDMRRAHHWCQNLACACGVLEFILYVFVEGFSWLFLGLMGLFAVLSIIADQLDKRYVQCPYCHHPLSVSGQGKAPELGRFCPHCGKELPRA